MIPPILMYHRIGQCPRGGDKNMVSPEKFELQLQFLEDQSYQTLTLGEWYRLEQAGEEIPARSVILTFDDGYRDNWEVAMPLLLRYGFKGTVFMVSDLLGKSNAWEVNAHRQGVEMMKPEHLKEWADAGLEVGSHGVVHQRVAGLAAAEMRKEAELSKATLEEVIGRSVDFFCYPHGVFDESAVAALKAAGYLGAVAIYDGASWGEPIDWFALPRLRVTDKDEPGIFRWKVSRYHSWLGRSRQWEKMVKKVFRRK